MCTSAFFISYLFKHQIKNDRISRTIYTSGSPTTPLPLNVERRELPLSCGVFMKCCDSIPLVCFILFGCATLAPERVPAPSGEVRLTPQWRTATGSNVRTVEVFVENGTASPLALSGLELDGVALPSCPPARRGEDAPPMPLWWKCTATCEASGRDAPTARPQHHADGADVSWKRPYQKPPTTDVVVPPGGHAALAVCFTNSPAPFELSLDANGERLAVAVPAPSFPRERIADVAFAPRGREVFVKVESRGVPVKTLLIDGVETPFRTLRDGRTGRPFVLAAETPKALRPDARLLVETRFADGGRAFASTRVLRGPVLAVQVADERTRRALGADVSPIIRPAPTADVGCHDLERKKRGAAAAAMLRGLAESPRPPEEITAVQFCTGCSSETWDIYGAIADAAFSLPFPVLRSNDPAERLEMEERAFLHASAVAAPRPVVWTASLFRYEGAMVPPDETLAAFWTTLALGSRGVTACLWKGAHGYTGMDSLPELRETWAVLEKALRKHRDRLFPLLAADRFDAAGGALKVYTAWNPGRGMLVVWRAADAKPLSGPLDFGVRIPEWLAPRDVRDLVRGGSESPRVAHRAISLRAPAGASHGAFWIDGRRR